MPAAAPFNLTRTMYRVDPLSHTADVGFEVRADTLAELFRGAADGLVRTLRADPEEDGDAAATGGERAAPTGEDVAPGREDASPEAERLSLERPDRERLMVGWLRELLYRATAEGRFPEEVRVDEVGPTSLEARVRWTPPGAAGLAREVKGVTYHGLRVERESDGRWHARLVLDV